jgi:ankyrin repeat protein
MDAGSEKREGIVMAAIDELFEAVVEDDVGRARRIVAEEPGLARAKGEDGITAAQLARYLGRGAMLEALIDAGPPLDVFEAAMLGRAARVAELLGADPALARAYSPDGFTALHFAAYYGSPETVALLIERGADIEAVTKNFLSNMPLHAAAAGRGPALETCEVLVGAGADVNAKQHGGFSVLHTPAHRGDLPMAELFLRHGADASATNDEGKTPVDVAREQGHSELAARLRVAARRAG